MGVLDSSPLSRALTISKKISKRTMEVASLKRDSPSSSTTKPSGAPAEWRMVVTETASVEATMQEKRTACCQCQPWADRSKT